MPGNDPPILETFNAIPGRIDPTTGNATVAYIESSFLQNSYRPDAQSFARHIQTLGADEEDYAQAVLGWSTYDTVFDVLTRFPPEFHPRKPWAWARSVDFVREVGYPTFTGPGNTLVYGGGLMDGGIELAITYEPVPGVAFLDNAAAPFGIDHEAWRYVKISEKFDIEQRVIPNGILIFNDGAGVPTRVPEPGVQMVPSSVFYIDWFQIPAVLDVNFIPQLPGQLAAFWANTQGRVNNAVFMGCPALTLYCSAPEKELVTMADGNLAWNIKYTLLRRGDSDYGDLTPGGNVATSTGPNWARLLTASGLYRRVYRSGDINKSIYDTADFYNLFRFGIGAVIAVA